MINYFDAKEKLLWSLSVIMILVSFYLFDKTNYLTLIASLIGVTSLIFLAKGNPIGQVLMIIFSTFYGYISFTFTYYGEMLTYMGMTLPMAIFSLVTWLSHPYEGNKSEVEVSSITGKDIYKIIIYALIVTTLFYFVLKYFNTANIVLSTFSITTSFIAAYLTMLRSPYYALGYACNDIVLVFMWIYASIYNPMYISVVVCFIAFLFNDLYGYYNWQKMHKRQK